MTLRKQLQALHQQLIKWSTKVHMATIYLIKFSPHKNGYTLVNLIDIRLELGVVVADMHSQHIA